MKFSRPTLPPFEQVAALYQHAHASEQLTDGALVRRLEDAAAERLGVRHAIAVSCCTSGLMLVLRALDLSGEVILPSFTFVATGHAVLWNRLTPVFVDCDAATWNLSVEDVEAKLTDRTCAILGVHLYGNPADVEGLTKLAARRGLKLIFDAAHGFGARYRSTPVGQFGDAEVFSLSPTKPLVAGEGGLITTNDSTLARRLRVARTYGREGDRDPTILGLNARMSEFHAAMALAGWDTLDERLRRMGHIAAVYRSLLGRLPGISFPGVHAADLSTYTNYSLTINEKAAGLGRDAIGRGLLERGFETRRYFSPPLHQQRLFVPAGGGAPPALANTERVAAGVISLPCYPALTDDDVAAVSSAISEMIAAATDPIPHPRREEATRRSARAEG